LSVNNSQKTPDNARKKRKSKNSLLVLLNRKFLMVMYALYVWDIPYLG